MKGGNYGVLQNRIIWLNNPVKRLPVKVVSSSFNRVIKNKMVMLENEAPEVWRYFKNGDVVRDADDSIWEDKLFEIAAFHGNAYCPMVSVYFYGKPKTRLNMANLDIREIKLMSAVKRPYKKLPERLLYKLIKKQNDEAKRELLIRVNNKKYNHV